MQKVIEVGKLEGLGVLTLVSMQRKSTVAKKTMAATDMPTIVIPITKMMARTGQNCQGGLHLHFDAIDRCQHFATCGFCVDSERISTSTTLKARVVGLADRYNDGKYAPEFVQIAQQM
jgi:hypothetical protein